MILLFGGTGDAVPLANGLVKLGEKVLLSNLTDDLYLEELDSRVRVRFGELDDEGVCGLIESHSIDLIVDSSHPYASNVQRNSYVAAESMNIPHLRFEREESSFSDFDVHVVDDHVEAAKLLGSISKRALLTIGSRFIETYSKELGHRVTLIARVLNNQKSITETLAADIDENNIIADRGPFSVEDNIGQIEEFNIDTIVTKDGGNRANVIEKLEAAKVKGISSVVIKRPKKDYDVEELYSYEALYSRVISIREKS